MDYSSNLVIFCLTLFLSNIFSSGFTLECEPPAIPMYGSYSNVKQKYKPQDKVEYKCDKGYHISGEKATVCQTNRAWTHRVPFCDPSFHLKQAVLQGKEDSLYLSEMLRSITDKINTTCFQMKRSDGLRIRMRDKLVIQAVRLFLPKGQYHFHVAFDYGRDKVNCGEFKGRLEQDQWKSLPCKAKKPTDSICIQSKGHPWEICEVEVYGKVDSGSSCNDPPPQQFSVPNGNLVISRERSILKCHGSKNANDTFQICESGEWKAVGNLSCEKRSDDPHKNLITAIVVSVVSVCLLLFCLIAVIIFVYKKRQNAVVVVMQSKDHYRRPPPESSAPEEAEYAVIDYDCVPLTTLSQIRKPLKIAPTNLPDLLGYLDPVDELSRNAGDLHKIHDRPPTPGYTEPQDALPDNNNQQGESLKESSFYGE